MVPVFDCACLRTAHGQGHCNTPAYPHAQDSPVRYYVIYRYPMKYFMVSHLKRRILLIALDPLEDLARITDDGALPWILFIVVSVDFLADDYRTEAFKIRGQYAALVEPLVCQALAAASHLYCLRRAVYFSQIATRAHICADRLKLWKRK